MSLGSFYHQSTAVHQGRKHFSLKPDRVTRYAYKPRVEDILPLNVFETKEMTSTTAAEASTNALEINEGGLSQSPIILLFYAALV